MNMRLRRFNESISREELYKFFNNHLSYLIDDGLYVSILSHTTLYYVVITSDKELNWSKIKDDLIPLLIVIDNKYNLLDFREVNKDYETISAWGDGPYNIKYDDNILNINNFIDGSLLPTDMFGEISLKILK